MSDYQIVITTLAAKLGLTVDLKAPPPSRTVLEVLAAKLKLRLVPDDEWDHD